jgi:hypothetical protein
MASSDIGYAPIWGLLVRGPEADLLVAVPNIKGGGANCRSSPIPVEENSGSDVLGIAAIGTHLRVNILLQLVPQ